MIFLFFKTRACLFHFFFLIGFLFNFCFAFVFVSSNLSKGKEIMLLLAWKGSSKTSKSAQEGKIIPIKCFPRKRERKKRGRDLEYIQKGSETVRPSQAVVSVLSPFCSVRLYSPFWQLPLSTRSSCFNDRSCWCFCPHLCSAWSGYSNSHLHRKCQRLAKSAGIFSLLWWCLMGLLCFLKTFVGAQSWEL